MAQRIVDEGHIIANHPYDHSDLLTTCDLNLREQIQKAQSPIEVATGVQSPIYRMPF